MDRVNRILKDEKYQYYLNKNKEAEKDRVFCHHDMVHFMDVARIGMILSLQEQIKIEKELLYGAALLHDIGRYKQYEDGTDHEKASAILAVDLLKNAGYDDKETSVIIEAISNHRNREIQNRKDLTGILYRADKLSRACFCCEMEKECNWKNDKKNRMIFL